MSNKANEPKRTTSQARAEAPFPPDEDTDNSCIVSFEDDGCFFDNNEVLTESGKDPLAPTYKSPFIRGTSIPVNDNEAVLMALINGDITLGDIRHTQGTPRLTQAQAKDHINKLRKIKEAEAAMAAEVKADAEALAKIKAEKAKIAYPAKVVFHSVPVVRGKDEIDVLEYAKLVGVPLRLCMVPDSRVFETLHKEFLWMEDGIKYLEDSCDMARRGNGILKFSPLLLLGASGVGKTSLVRRFCELSNIPYLVLSAGGSNDSMLIKGIHRSWSSARPGSVVDYIKQYKVANPVIIIDEIDKASQHSVNGNLVDSLIQMLEPSSSSVWMDEFLQGRVDLSSVNFMMTANDITKLSSPLLSRTRHIDVGYLSQKHLLYAIPRLITEISDGYGIAKALIPEMDSHIAETISRKCGDLRKLKSAVQAWFLVAVKQEDKHTGHTLH